METNHYLQKTLPETDERHFRQSSYREMIVETLFLGGLLQHLWSVGAPTAEVLHSMRDNGGYDLTIECNSVVRFIQLKTMVAPRRVRLNTRLAAKPGACVVGILIAPQSLEIKGYRWLGWDARVPSYESELSGFSEFSPALSLRYDKNGKRLPLSDTRIAPISAFESIPTVSALAERLFGCTSHN